MNTKPYLALALVAGLGLALGACSSSSDDPMPDYTLDDVQMGATVTAGTHTISADLAEAFEDADPSAAMYLDTDFETGAIVSVAGLDFACTAGPCRVTLAPDGSHVTTTGTIEVVMMGGEFPTAMRPPDPEPEPEAHVCDDGPSEACVAARQEELDAIEDDDDATVGQLNAAREALETAQTELSDANTAMEEENTVSGLIETAMGLVDGITFVADGDDNSTPNDVKAAEEAIQAAQDSLDGMENLSDETETALQGRIDALTTSLSPNAMAVRMAAATAAAGTKRKAIGTEADQTTDAGLGGTARTDADGTTADDPSDDVYGIAISRKSGEAATIKVTDPANAADDDPKFAMNDMGMLVRTMEADADGNVMSEVVLVTTDIEEPKATAFAMVPNQALDVSSATGLAATSPEVDNALAIATDTDLTGDPNANLMFARSTTNGVLNYTGDNPVAGEPATVGVVEGLHDGTYNGAEGTYRCTSGTTACTVTFNAKGEVIGNSAGWVFVPDKGATSLVDDTDYLHYGFWLKRTTDEDGNVEYNEVETFAGSSLDASGDIATVAGSASYEGGATGVYVNDVLNPDGTTARSTSGHFTADAELTATFGGQVNDAGGEATIAANMLNTVRGTIDNFELSGGESNTWSVALSGDITPADSTFTGTAKGGVGDGSFSGTFHGTATGATGQATLTSNDSVYPPSAVGEFNAGFTNGSVAGAFGVRKTDD